MDISAVIAVLLGEPGCGAIIERLCRAEQPALAAPTRTEILAVAQDPQLIQEPAATTSTGKG